MSSNYVEVVDGRGEYRSIPFRHAWPAELDLTAWAGRATAVRAVRSAGPVSRFTSESTNHVSVWQNDRVDIS